MKKILFPTDFSENSIQALRYALEMLNLHVTDILIYHAYTLPIIDVNMPASIFEEVAEKEEAKARIKLDEIADSIKKDYPKITIQTKTGQEFAAEKISALTKQNNSDLIVMGTRGASGLKEVFMGSNTASVINNTEVPVLAVPANLKYKPITKILFTTDYHDSDFEAIRKVAELASSLQAEITIMHLFQYDKELETTMQEWFKEELESHVHYARINYELDESSDVEDSLGNYIEEHKMDMLVMSTKKRSFIQRFFHSSLTRRMVYHTHIPLLAFHYSDTTSSEGAVL